MPTDEPTDGHSDEHTDESTDAAASAPTDANTADATAAPAEPVNQSGPFVAKAGKYYRNARYIMVALVFFGGLYFGYDGFIGYPKENAAREAAPEAKKAEMEFHESLDINIQKLLCFTLPPLALGMLAFWIHKSRGTVSLLDGVLSVPGHPPITLDDVTKLDKRLWDRKGIAHLSYETTQGQSGKLTLDDFIYERKPVDQIYDAVVANLKERAAQVEPAQGFTVT